MFSYDYILARDVCASLASAIWRHVYRCRAEYILRNINKIYKCTNIVSEEKRPVNPTVNNMVADGLATQGARASAAMWLTWISRNIPVARRVKWLNWGLGGSSQNPFRNMMLEFLNLIMVKHAVIYLYMIIRTHIQTSSACFMRHWGRRWTGTESGWHTDIKGLISNKHFGHCHSQVYLHWEYRLWWHS